MGTDGRQVRENRRELGYVDEEAATPTTTSTVTLVACSTATPRQGEQRPQAHSPRPFGGNVPRQTHPRWPVPSGPRTPGTRSADGPGGVRAPRATRPSRWRGETPSRAGRALLSREPGSDIRLDVRSCLTC